MTRPAKAHGLVDCWPEIGLVRDSQRREETFYELATSIAVRQGIDLAEYEIAPPNWEWQRINPCSPNLCGEHAWHYGSGKAGQSGSFIGSLITMRRKPGAS